MTSSSWPRSCWSCRPSVLATWAATRLSSRAGAWAKSTRLRARQALSAQASAKCVLPTPGGPTSKIFVADWRKARSPSSPRPRRRRPSRAGRGCGVGSAGAPLRSSSLTSVVVAGHELLVAGQGSRDGLRRQRGEDHRAALRGLLAGGLLLDDAAQERE